MVVKRRNTPTHLCSLVCKCMNLADLSYSDQTELNILSSRNTWQDWFTIVRRKTGLGLPVRPILISDPTWRNDLTFRKTEAKKEEDDETHQHYPNHNRKNSFNLRCEAWIWCCHVTRGDIAFARSNMTTFTTQAPSSLLSKLLCPFGIFLQLFFRNRRHWRVA